MTEQERLFSPFNNSQLPACLFKGGELIIKNEAFSKTGLTGAPFIGSTVNEKGKSYKIYKVPLLSECELVLLFDITDAVRLAEENEKYKRELELAKSIQASLIKNSIPQIKDYLFTLAYYPSAEVGGDLFDAIRLKDGRILMYVADVSGHGVAAAMMTVFFKQQISLFCKQEKFTFKRLIEFLNERLSELNCDKRVYLTLFLAIIDTDSGELSYCNAGHSAIPLICRENGEIEELYCPGVPVCTWGIEADFVVKHTVLRRGERIIIYTDGVLPPKDYEEAFLELKKIFGDKNFTSQGFIRKISEFLKEDHDDDVLMIICARQ